MTWRAQVLTTVEADSGRSPLADSVTRFGQAGALCSFQGEGASLGSSQPAAAVLACEPLSHPVSSPPKSALQPGSGPRPLWQGFEARGAGAGAGSVRRGPFKEPRCGNPSTQSSQAGWAAAGPLGRLPGSAEHLAGGLWPAPAPGPWPEDQAPGTRPHVAAARTLVAPGRCTGDAVCRAQGGARVSLAPRVPAPA